jgi:hypothetical protein
LFLIMSFMINSNNNRLKLYLIIYSNYYIIQQTNINKKKNNFKTEIKKYNLKTHTHTTLTITLVIIRKTNTRINIQSFLLNE